jgi:HEAT repeat protein
MADRLAITMNVLAESPNEAAVAVLLEGLDSSQRDVRDLALAAILNRRSEAAELEILHRWNDLSMRWKTQIAERVGWISGAIRKAVLSADTGLYECGCAAAVFTRDYDLIPVLVAAATDRANPHAPLAAAAALELAEFLSEELAAPRDYRIRRDPQLQRHHVLPSLERAVMQLQDHGRRELLEAFLLLASRENAVLKRLLQTPGDRNFQPLVDVLTASPRPGIERLLLSYLDDPHAPLSAVQVIGRRCDVSFLRHLTRKIGAEPSPIARMNVRRIENIPWITSTISLLDALSEAEQPGAVHLVVGSSAPRQHALEAAGYVLRHGKVPGRRIAARLLAEFRTPQADELAAKAIDDEDPLVRAAIASQLRDRCVPGAINRLIELLDSPHQAEREAAQASLDEFTFARFAANFDSLTDEARQTTGALVRRVDRECLTPLRAEFEAPTRSRRKRALAMAVALGAVVPLYDAIAALLKDDDPFLRVETIHVLTLCDSQRTRMLLREAMVDTHPLVQDAAEAALAQLTRGDTVAAQGQLRDTTPLAGAAGQGEALPPAAPEAASTLLAATESIS